MVGSSVDMIYIIKEVQEEKVDVCGDHDSD